MTLAIGCPEKTIKKVMVRFSPSHVPEMSWNVPEMSWNVPDMPWNDMTLTCHMSMGCHDLSLTYLWQVSPCCIAVQALAHQTFACSTVTQWVSYCRPNLGRYLPNCKVCLHHGQLRHIIAQNCWRNCSYGEAAFQIETLRAGGKKQGSPHLL